MDPKSLAVGGLFSLLGVAVGGGIYGLYVSQTSKLLYGELTAYTLVSECAALQLDQSPDPGRVQDFISKVHRQSPHALASLAIVGAASGQDKTGTPVAVQVGDVLNQCAKKLQENPNSGP